MAYPYYLEDGNRDTRLWARVEGYREIFESHPILKSAFIYDVHETMLIEMVALELEVEDLNKEISMKKKAGEDAGSEVILRNKIQATLLQLRSKLNLTPNRIAMMQKKGGRNKGTSTRENKQSDHIEMYEKETGFRMNDDHS